MGSGSRVLIRLGCLKTKTSSLHSNIYIPAARCLFLLDNQPAKHYMYTSMCTANVSEYTHYIMDPPTHTHTHTHDNGHVTTTIVTFTAGHHTWCGIVLHYCNHTHTHLPYSQKHISILGLHTHTCTCPCHT